MIVNADIHVEEADPVRVSARNIQTSGCFLALGHDAMIVLPSREKAQEVASALQAWIDASLASAPPPAIPVATNVIDLHRRPKP